MAQVDNYEWLDYIPQGWRKLAKQMIQECEAIYPEWKICDLKEKFGALRCYDEGVPSTLRDNIDSILEKYETISERTCTQCGAPATRYTTGWIMPFCSNCGSSNWTYKKIEYED